MVRIVLPAFALMLMLLQALAHDHPPGIDREFLNTLEKPDGRFLDPSLTRRDLCCTERDAVRVRYRVDQSTGQDVWYVWFNDVWTKIDDNVIVSAYAPSGQAYIFVVGTGIRCFVRPRGDF